MNENQLDTEVYAVTRAAAAGVPGAVVELDAILSEVQARNPGWDGTMETVRQSCERLFDQNACLALPEGGHKMGEIDTFDAVSYTGKERNDTPTIRKIEEDPAP